MRVVRNPTSTAVHDVRHVALSGWCAREARIDANALLPVHAHDEVLIRLVLEGALVETIDRRTTLVEPGALMYYHPAVTHMVRVPSAPARYFSVELGQGWLDRLRAYSIAIPSNPSALGVESERCVRRLFREFARDDEVSPLSMEGCALELLASVARCATATRERGAPPWLRRAREVLRERFSLPPSLVELAEEVDIHPSHLTRAFRERYGCTLGEYVRDLRVEYAVERLARTETPLAEIAVAAGFADQSHFTRVFKNATGVTPARFRADARGRDTGSQHFN